MTARNILFIASLLIFGVAINAQNEQRELKLLLEKAQKSGQKVLIIFEGSDWCAPCIKLEKEIISTEVFQNFINDDFMIIKADFPRNRKNKLSPSQISFNNMLAEKYNTNGYFPLVVAIDYTGTVLGMLGYEKTSPEKYIQKINAFYREN